jgi:myo-inositol catabolism protein IolS
MNKMWIGTELFNGCFGNFYTQRDVDNIINHAYEIGINKIDTAECYNIEKIIGNSISQNKNKFKVATKFGHQFHKGKKYHSFGLDDVKKQLENSLKSLKVDHIDLYYFHSGTNLEFNNDKLWIYLNDMKAHGVIGSLGLSLQHDLVIKQDFYQINQSKDYGISVVQTVLNKYSRDSLKYVIPYCKNNDIKVLGRMPLAKGLLTGKYNSNHIFNDDDSRSNSLELNKEIINNNSNHSHYSALSWCSNNVDEIVIGSKNISQLEENNLVINRL